MGGSNFVFQGNGSISDLVFIFFLRFARIKKRVEYQNTIEIFCYMLHNLSFSICKKLLIWLGSRKRNGYYHRLKSLFWLHLNHLALRKLTNCRCFEMLHIPIRLLYIL